METEQITDIKQVLINRIDKLKKDRKKYYDEEEKYKYSVISMNIDENTRNFYNYTCDRLIKELEDILNVIK